MSSFLSCAIQSGIIKERLNTFGQLCTTIEIDKHPEVHTAIEAIGIYSQIKILQLADKATRGIHMDETWEFMIIWRNDFERSKGMSVDMN